MESNFHPASYHVAPVDQVGFYICRVLRNTICYPAGVPSHLSMFFRRVSRREGRIRHSKGRTNFLFYLILQGGGDTPVHPRGPIFLYLVIHFYT